MIEPLEISSQDLRSELIVEKSFNSNIEDLPFNNLQIWGHPVKIVWHDGYKIGDNVLIDGVLFGRIFAQEFYTSTGECVGVVYLYNPEDWLCLENTKEQQWKNL